MLEVGRPGLIASMPFFKISKTSFSMFLFQPEIKLNSLIVFFLPIDLFNEYDLVKEEFIDVSNLSE